MPLFHHIQLQVFALLCATLLAYLLTPLAMWLGFKLGLVDQPGGRRIHVKPTPRSGGLAVFVAFFGSLLLFSSSHILGGFNPEFSRWLQVTLFVSCPLVVLGLIDDRWEVRPFIKLLGQLAVAFLAWSQGLQLERILGVSMPPYLDSTLTVLIFLAAMNAYNLIDGMDGVAGGLGAVTGFGLCGLNLMQGNVEIAAACLALSGACIGFLRYNFHPARVFLGDTGSMFIGFILIALTFGSQARSAAAIMLIVPLLTLGVPLLDTGLAIWRRTVRKAMNPGTGTKVSQGDKDHLHHRLARAGLTQRRVAFTLYCIQATVFAVGLLWVFVQNHRLAIFTGAFFVGSYVLIRYLASLELSDSGKLIVDGIRRPSRNRLYSSLMPFMDIATLGIALAGVSWLSYPDFASLRLTTLFRESAATIIGGPMILLWATRYYRPQWTRARAVDFFFIGFIATIGVLIGVSLSPLPQELPIKATLRIGILIAAFTAPPMVLLRAFPRLVQDLVHFHERKKNSSSGESGPRVLVYGAGCGYTLLTRAESFDDTQTRRPYQLVGLVDDDPFLKGNLIHGHPVLGALDDLPALIRSQQIQEILMTIRLGPTRQTRLMEIADEFNLRVTQSLFLHQTLREKA